MNVAKITCTGSPDQDTSGSYPVEKYRSSGCLPWSNLLAKIARDPAPKMPIGPIWTVVKGVPHPRGVDHVATFGHDDGQS
jgi:hypothetical protein